MIASTSQTCAQNKMQEIIERAGENIQYLRKKRNMTQEQLAEALSINSQALISQYEHGKKVLTLEKLIEFADFFGIPVEELLFSEFYKRPQNNQVESKEISADENSPIQKCVRRTYYCYYIREINNGKKESIANVVCRRLDILSPTSAYDAPALLYQNSEKQSGYINGQINMDESYAYIKFHDKWKDFYFALSFYYYRQKSSRHYTCGIALMQTVEQHNVPISQFCIITSNAISSKRYGDLKKFLQFDFDKKDDRLSNRTISSQSVLRLTKERDAAVYNWLCK